MTGLHGVHGNQLSWRRKICNPVQRHASRRWSFQQGAVSNRDFLTLKLLLIQTAPSSETAILHSVVYEAWCQLGPTLSLCQWTPCSTTTRGLEAVCVGQFLLRRGRGKGYHSLMCLSLATSGFHYDGTAVQTWVTVK